MSVSFDEIDDAVFQAREHSVAIEFDFVGPVAVRRAAFHQRDQLRLNNGWHLARCRLWCDDARAAFQQPISLA